MGMELRWLGPDEVDLGREYIDALWKRGHILARSAELFRWQYRAAPCEDHLGFLIASDAGRPVGCVGRIYFDGHLAGRKFPCGVMTCFISDPEYRASGLGLRIMKMAYGNYGLVMNIGSSAKVCRMYRLMGQYIADPMPRYVCIVDEKALSKMLRLGEGGTRLVLGDYKRCGRLRRLDEVPNGIQIIDLTEELMPTWDEAWGATFAPILGGIFKDAQYLRWRYLQHPTFKYDLFLAKGDDGRLCGLACLRVITLSNDCLAVRVLEFLAADHRTGLALANEIVRRVPPSTAFVEHIAMGNAWQPMKNIGLSAEGAELFSIHFSPPHFGNNHIKAAFHVALPGMTPEKFICAPETYITIADGDQDRPN